MTLHTLTRELSELRRFKVEVERAFGTTDTEKLYLASEVVELARPASVQWEMSPSSFATSEAMKEQCDAVKAMARHRTVLPMLPLDKAVEENMERKSGAFEGPDELDPVNDPRRRE